MNRKERRFQARRGATASPGLQNELFAAAVAQHRAGAFTEAERRYRHLLAQYPDHADSLHNLGLLALTRGDAAAAVDSIAKAIKLADEVAEYHYNIALAYRALARTDDVAAHLERAVELRRDHTLAHLNLGNIRREQGRYADAIACYRRVLALDPNSPAAHFNLANVLAEQRRWDDAVAEYRRTVAIDPNNAEAHHHLGTALTAQGKTDEAIPHFESAVITSPDIAGGYEDLSAAYSALGKADLAAYAAARALERRETPANKRLFVQSVCSMRFTAQNAPLRALLLRALLEGWARPREIDKVCISAIVLGSEMQKCIARATSAWPGRVGAEQLFGSSGPAALANDELLIAFLRYGILSDFGLECVMTNVRRVMLARALSGSGDDQHLGFYAAVAQQCFINDYLYAVTDEEVEHVSRLQLALVEALDGNAAIPALWPVAVAAYVPLHTVAGASDLLRRSWPSDIAPLLTQQIEEPAQERRIAAALPMLTDFDNAISRAVGRQYEENPYPRWVAAGLPVPSSSEAPLAGKVDDVLIAGCGTGLSAIHAAQQVPDKRVLAIDLSRASLSYAKRMAERFGVSNIEFAQADLLRLGEIGRQFDVIDSSGVLHHLADPWAGWRVLLSLLRSGGAMQVGLYSELARPGVVAARALIAERGYRPIASDIRRCRAEIVASADPLLKTLMQSSDFYTISDCRDLLFHVQEHRVTLPEIKSFIAASGVEFNGFILDDALRRRFTARFAQPSALTDLDCWHAFETDAPGTFAGMYEFWVRKP